MDFGNFGRFSIATFAVGRLSQMQLAFIFKAWTAQCMDESKIGRLSLFISASLVHLWLHIRLQKYFNPKCRCFVFKVNHLWIDVWSHSITHVADATNDLDEHSNMYTHEQSSDLKNKHFNWIVQHKAHSTIYSSNRRRLFILRCRLCNVLPLYIRYVWIQLKSVMLFSELFIYFSSFLHNSNQNRFISLSQFTVSIVVVVNKSPTNIRQIFNGKTLIWEFILIFILLPHQLSIEFLLCARGDSWTLLKKINAIIGRSKHSIKVLLVINDTITFESKLAKIGKNRQK